jgi:hypothetical protein
LWRGGLSYRRLWVLVRHLPADSWTQTGLRDDPKLAELNPATPGGEQKFGPWRLENYQLAAVLDAIAGLHYLTAVVGNIKDPKAPDPTPRPGLRSNSDAVERDPELTEATVHYLDKLRARG